MLNVSYFWQKFQNKNMVQQRRTMEGKIDSMTAKKNIIKGVIFVTPAIGSLNKGDLFLLLAITSLFFFPCFVPKLTEFADLVQTMAQVRVSNTAEDAALVLCLRQHLSSNLGGGAFKGEIPLTLTSW